MSETVAKFILNELKNAGDAVVLLTRCRMKFAYCSQLMSGVTSLSTKI